MHRSDRFISINPTNGNILYEVESWNVNRINQELKQGDFDWKLWRDLSVKERLKQVINVKNSLCKREDEAALLITKEMGKPISQAKAEIRKCIDLCEYYLKYSEDVLSQDVVEEAPFQFNEIVYQPLGGILGIMPWNFPFWQVFRFALPALISGNLIWLKHAPNMSLCNQFIEEIFNAEMSYKIYRAVFVQISDLEKLVEHKHIQGTSLTGSERAGSSFAALSGKHIKKTLLELGGNDAFIVCEDADLTEAIPKAVFSRMINSGQTCISTKRLYIPQSRLEDVKTRLLNEIKTYVFDDLNKSSTKIGVMARQDLADTVNRQIIEIKDLGFEHWITVGEDSECFIAPRIYFSNTDVFYDKELFGPVLLVYGYSDIEDVLDSVNGSEFGLGTAIWSSDIAYAKVLAKKVYVGSVAINNIVQSSPYLPFGGVKKSGFGRELGKDSLLEFVNKKVIYS